MKTYGQQFDEALRCQTRADASEWLRKEIEELRELTGKSEDESRKILLANLGYMTGYYDREVAVKINFLFGAVHPIFGMTEPTPEEAFTAGQKLGENLKRLKEGT